mmetsp:Transcript_7681/g.20464  ORF Transcript_7681/g.20464 Transcript_7681/m.20464 type:complete len:232 (-) Transcript_7681:337-1032(-)
MFAPPPSSSWSSPSNSPSSTSLSSSLSSSEASSSSKPPRRPSSSYRSAQTCVLAFCIAIPTTCPLVSNNGPPHTPLFMAASTCKASIDRALWLYSTTSTRDNTPDVKQKDSPPMGNPAKVTGSCSAGSWAWNLTASMSSKKCGLLQDSNATSASKHTAATLTSCSWACPTFRTLTLRACSTAPAVVHSSFCCPTATTNALALEYASFLPCQGLVKEGMAWWVLTCTTCWSR